MGKDLKGKELGVGLGQRKDGAYIYRYTIRGQRREEKFDKISEAKKRKTEIDYWKTHNVLNKNNRVTLNSWFEFSIKYYHINNKDKTISNYTFIYDTYIKTALGSFYIDEISTSQIAQFFAELQENKKYSRNTLNAIKKILSMLFNEAVADDRILKNPINKNIKLVNQNCEKIRTALSDEQFNEFECEARKSKFYLMLMIAAETGMRAGELGALDFEKHIDFKNEIIKVRSNLNERKFMNTEKVFCTPKSKESVRDIPMTKEVKEYLKSQIAISKSIYSENPKFKNLLFKSRTGNPIYPRDLYKAIQYIESRINQKREQEAKERNTEYTPFPHIHPHALRYTFATECMKKGVQPKAVQKILGHSDIKVTMNIYTQSDKEYLKEEIAKIGKIEEIKFVENNNNVIDFFAYKQSI